MEITTSTLEEVQQQLAKLVSTDDSLWLTQNISRWRHKFYGCSITNINDDIEISWLIPTNIADFATRITYRVDNLKEYCEPNESIIIDEPDCFFRELFTHNEHFLQENKELSRNLLQDLDVVHTYLKPLTDILDNYGKSMESLKLQHIHEPLLDKNYITATFDVIPNEVQCKVYIDLYRQQNNYVNITDHYWRTTDILLTYLSDICQ